MGGTNPYLFLLIPVKDPIAVGTIHNHIQPVKTPKPYSDNSN